MNDEQQLLESIQASLAKLGIQLEQPEDLADLASQLFAAASERGESEEFTMPFEAGAGANLSHATPHGTDIRVLNGKRVDSNGQPVSQPTAAQAKLQKEQEQLAKQYSVPKQK